MYFCHFSWTVWFTLSFFGEVTPELLDFLYLLDILSLACKSSLIARSVRSHNQKNYSKTEKQAHREFQTGDAANVHDFSFAAYQVRTSETDQLYYTENRGCEKFRCMLRRCTALGGENAPANQAASNGLPKQRWCAWLLAW